MNFPKKFLSFLNTRTQQDLFPLVKEMPNLSRYSLPTNVGINTTAAALRSVPDMLQDPVIGSAVAYHMETAFPMNSEQKVFWVVSNYEQLVKELEEFHAENEFQQLALDLGYNILSWGNVPLEHKFDNQRRLIGVRVEPDFTRVVPIVLSGITVGYIVDGEYHYPFEYTYAQAQYYRNFGGILSNAYTIGGSSTDTIKNEFVLSPSYLSSASKPWRNVNIIEDALLLARMDQSNYYRILAVDVGGSVYSKSAIQVLNYYRNLFKKVRRVSYDPAGMAAHGANQEFEVIIPKSGTQGIEVTQVGGNVNIEALKDLETQYNKLFAALRVQPSQIGFDSKTPSTLNGEGPSVLWDQRSARLCKALVFSVLKAIKHIDEVYLRSRGYDVQASDWHYGTVSNSILEDKDRADALSTSVDALQKLTQQLRDNQVPYDKTYLFTTMLNNSLSPTGIDMKRLFNVEEKKQLQSIKTSLYLTQPVTSRAASAMLTSGFINENQYQVLNSSSSKLKINSSVSAPGPLTLQQVKDDVLLVSSSTPVDLTNTVTAATISTAELIKNSKQVETMVTLPVQFPVYVTSDVDLNFTLDEIQKANFGCIDQGVLHKEQLILTSREDLLKYLSLYLSDYKYAVVGEVRSRK